MILMSDLLERIIETTGLDVVTLGSLKAAVKNCLADLTSRGYKEFHELDLAHLEGAEVNGCMLKAKLPQNISKIVYVRLYFPNGAEIARRVSLSDKRVGCIYVDGEFRSRLNNRECIYYTKGDEFFVEWHPALSFDLVNATFGYYARLSMPDNFPDDPDDVSQLRDVKLEIRDEYVDAIVFYACYFYYSRYIKDTDKIQFYDAKYKYYVEDISHELAYEDEYNEEDAVIKVEDD